MKSFGSITDFMAKKLITFKPSDDIRSAIETIVKKGISGAPVVDDEGNLVGILSEKDCIRTIIGGPYNQAPGAAGVVADFMSTNVKTIAADRSILDAAYEFALTPYRRFPVIDKGKLVGQISRHDILKAILKFKPEVKRVPSSWKLRAPQLHPDKRSTYKQNS